MGWLRRALGLGERVRPPSEPPAAFRRRSESPAERRFEESRRAAEQTIRRAERATEAARLTRDEALSSLWGTPWWREGDDGRA